MADACYQAWKQVEFDHLDLNHDGQLTLQEWNDEQARIKKRLEEARLQMQNEFFRYADSDSNGSLNEKEFEQFLKSRPLGRANASKYLESIGGTMDFNEFVKFEKSVPNDTFPFKFEPFDDDGSISDQLETLDFNILDGDTVNLI
uniref:EF-hand domain-containing protein n=1 Tax=Panagrolaimus sp. JU765 TaxID=591449 RepID=A0AC34Q6I5_9BILA